MLFMNILKNVGYRNAVDRLFGRYQQVPSQKLVTFLYKMIIGDAANNFVFYCSLKLNSSKATKHTNFKLGSFILHTKVRVALRFVMS